MEFNADPNTNWRLHIVLLGLCGLAVAIGGTLGFLAIPMFAWVASRWIVALFLHIKRRAERDATHDWQGRYYAFDGTQVRVFWDASRLWIVADDIFAQLGAEVDTAGCARLARRSGGELAKIPGSVLYGFSEAGALQFLDQRRETTALKLRQWIQRALAPSIRHCQERGELNMPEPKR